MTSTARTFSLRRLVLLLAAVLAPCVSFAAAPVSETFDGVSLSGGYSYGTPGAARTINGWTFSLLGAAGTIDPNGYVDVTNQSFDTSLADDGSDKAALLNGTAAGGTGTQAAAVLAAASGEEFSFLSVRVEVGFSSGNDYRLVGYLNGSVVSGATQNFTAGNYGSGGTLVTVSGAAWQYVDAVRIVRQNGDADVSVYIDDITVTTAVLPNVAPVVANLNGDSGSYTEGAAATLLDAGSNATVTDSDSPDFNTGTVTVSVTANATTSEDVLAIRNEGTGGGQIGASAGTLTYGGTTIGTYTGGTSGANLVVTLNANSTPTSVQALLRNLTYRNSNSGEPSTATRTIRVTVTDGDGGTSNHSDVSMSVVGINTRPTLSVSFGTVGFTEGGAAADLYSSPSISTVESGQSIDLLTFTVSNVADGASEIVAVDGTDVALTNGNSGTTTTNSMSFSVSESSGTATVTISKVGGISTAAAQTLVDALSYRNTSDAPSTTSRVVTLTSIRDTGGTANGGLDTRTISIATTVTVAGVNDAPTLTTVSTLTGATEDTQYVITFAALAAAANEADVEGDTLSFRVEAVSTGTLTKGGGAVTPGVTLLGTGETLEWTPAGDANGTLNAFTIRAWDGALASASAVQVQVSVAATNDAPTLTSVSTLTGASEDTPFTIAYATLAAAADEADIDLDALSFRVEAVSTGTLTKGGTPVTPGSTLLGTGESLVWTPAADASGTLNAFTIRAWDGTAASASAIQVQVTAAPGAETPSVTAATTNEDTQTTSGLVITRNVADGNEVTHFKITSITGGTLYQNDGTTVIANNAFITAAEGNAGLRFTPTANANSTSGGPFTFSVQAGTDNSGGGLSASAATATITVTAVNDAPVVTASGGTTAYVEGNNTTATLAVDSGVTVSDLDNTTLAAATVSITANFQSAEDVLAFSNTNSTTFGNITASYNSGTGVLTLTSSGATATVAQWQAALRAVTYANSSETPNTANRTITFAVDDGAASSPNSNKTLSVTATDDSPVVTTSGGTTAFTEGANTASTPVAIDSGLTVTDADTSTLASATISVTGSFQNAEDVLAFTNDGSTMGNVSGSYNAGIGVLTLTSAGATATKAQWQAALRAVTYSNSSDAPNPASRTISFVANDGNSSSTAATKTVSITVANDTPTDILLSASTVNQGAGANATVGTLSGVDSDDSSFTFTLVAGTGDTSNALFNISGSTLRATAPAGLAPGSHSIRVQVDDGDTLGTFAKVLSVTVVDNLAPVVSSIVRQSPTTQNISASSVTFRVTFSEAVTGVGAGDFTLVRSAGTGSIASASAVSGAVYDVVVNSLAGPGSVQLNLTAAGAGIADLASNAFVADYTAGETYTVVSVPGITSSLTAGGTYGGTFPTYTVTASPAATSFAASGLPTGLSLNPTTGAITGTPTQSGTFNVSLTGTNGSGTGSPSTLVITIAKATLTVTASNQSRAFGAANPAFTFNYGGFVNGDTSAVLTATPTATTTAISSSTPGSYTITPSGGAAANYTFAYVNGTLTVTSASVGVTLGGLAQTYNGSPRVVDVTISPAGVPYSLTYSGSSTAPTNAGTYTIEVSVSSGNYSGGGFGVLTVAKASQTVTFAAIGSPGTSKTATLSATASSNLPVTFSVVSGPATIAGSTLTFTGGGSVTVRASQAGNENYLPATADQTVSGLEKQAQTIAFGALGDKSSTDAAFTISATASSGLPVSFALVSGPALLSGATVTLTGAPGTVEIRATQAGNDTYQAAPDVTRSFTVTSAGPRVFIGDVLAPGSMSPAGDLGAVLPPDDNTGRLVIVSPTFEINLAFNFTLSPDGTFVQIITIDDAGLAEVDPRTPPRAAAARTFTVRGRLVNNLLTGRIEENGLTFNVPVQGRGPTSGAAGFYQSTQVNSASGGTSTIIGNNGEVVVVAQAGSTAIGGRTTLNASGGFALQTGTGSLSGSVDTATATVSGTISRPGQANTNFSGTTAAAVRTDRLANLSSRVRVGPAGGRTLITGFVIGGTEPKRLLLRAVGPALAGFGVTGALANPRLEIYNSAGTRVLQNDDWSGADTSAAFAQVGAFALASGSRDAALLTTLAPGAYTMIVPDGGDTGVALAEIYDASTNPSGEPQRLVNISTRGLVESGDGALIGGFVVTGNLPKRVLVRGVGPALAAFGVSGALADPRLAIYSGTTVIAQNDDWGTPVAVNATQTAATATEIAAAAQTAGAFVFPANSKDAAIVIVLAPGAYTAQVTGAGTTTGTGLVEVYELP